MTTSPASGHDPDQLAELGPVVWGETAVRQDTRDVAKAGIPVPQPRDRLRAEPAATSRRSTSTGPNPGSPNESTTRRLGTPSTRPGLARSRFT